MNAEIKKILSIAGSDSIGGAGIQADIKTISAFGHYAMTAITAVTAQNTLGVRLCEAVSAEMMKAQIEAVFEDIPPNAVKIGMTGNLINGEIIAEALKRYNARNIVCDPVLSATTGGQLTSGEGKRALIKHIFPLADIITPNIPEAEQLCGMQIRTVGEMERAARILSGTTPGAVLVKGGHLPGDRAEDILLYGGRIYEFTSPRIDNPNTHGSGCTLSSAAACGLAEGKDVPESVRQAKDYISRAIGYGLDIGRGNGPLRHLGVRG